MDLNSKKFERFKHVVMCEFGAISKGQFREKISKLRENMLYLYIIHQLSFESLSLYSID